MKDFPKQVSLSYSKNFKVKIKKGIKTKLFDVEEVAVLHGSLHVASNYRKGKVAECKVWKMGVAKE